MHFEGLSGAINVSIVAFSIVFGVLLVLTGMIFAMRLFAGSGEEKKNDVAPSKPAPAPVKAAPVAALKAPAVNADKAKIVAAITAAIIEFTGGSDFKILSVQQENAGVPGDYWTSRWKTAGMLALNSNRLNRKWH
ncbi:MAG: OadG family protein [Synergistaceae bacterium]|nr:OadG family protein [Synergistaceae bacterium]